MLEEHVGVQPLHFLDDIDTGMHDELVHVASCLAVAKARDAIAACFGRAKGKLEERFVRRRDDDEVVGHIEFILDEKKGF